METGRAEEPMMCGHPELYSMWGQEKPKPVRMVGPCQHDMTCPMCKWGWGCAPDPCIRLQENDERLVSADCN